MGDSAGLSGQLWSRLVNDRIQAQLQNQAQARFAELVPGLERVNATDAVASKTTDALPEVFGDVSVDVALSCDGVTALFPGVAEAAEPGMQVAVTGAECVFRAFSSGDATVDISLLTADLALQGRRLLMPRRAGKLLDIKIVRLVDPEPVMHWTASWAQVCILFRRRPPPHCKQAPWEISSVAMQCWGVSSH